MIKKTILSVILILSFQASYALDDDRVFAFVLKSSFLKASNQNNDDVVYCGITKDPEGRATELTINPIMRYDTFDAMLVYAGPMTREQAKQEKTRCINNHYIPRLYQTYPTTDRERSHQSMEIKSREANSASLPPKQVTNPRVEYTPNIVRDDHYSPPMCEECDAIVTDEVIKRSCERFNNRVYCLSCQDDLNELIADDSQNYSDGTMPSDSANSSDNNNSETAANREAERIPLRLCKDCKEPIIEGISNNSRNRYCKSCQERIDESHAINKMIAKNKHVAQRRLKITLERKRRAQEALGQNL